MEPWHVAVVWGWVGGVIGAMLKDIMSHFLRSPTGTEEPNASPHEESLPFGDTARLDHFAEEKMDRIGRDLFIDALYIVDDSSESVLAYRS